MFKKKSFLFVAAFLALSLILVACGGGNGTDTDETDNGDTGADTEVTTEDTDTSTDGPAVDGGGVGVTGQSDELIFITGGEIPTLDPHGANMQQAAMVNNHVLETLVVHDTDLNIVPHLATSWEVVDEQTWRFYIRDDVYFHDGTKLTARDVAFSITRSAEAPMVAPITGMIDVDSINVIDDYTVEIGTNYPFAPFLHHLTHRAASVISADAMGDVPGGPDTDFDLIVGSGPYQVIENTPGDRLVLERWDDWHGMGGDLPNMRLITFRIMIDPPARTFAMETGEADIMMGAAAADITRLQEDPNLIMPAVQSLQTEYIVFNTQRIDRLVRQAINYALDVDTIVDMISEGHQSTAVGFVGAQAFGHNPNFEPHPYDVERARELMIEAGFSGEPGAADLSFEMLVQPEGARTQSAEIIARQVEEIGISIELNMMEFNTMNENYIQEGLHYIAPLGWTTVTGDADYQFFPLFHSSSATNHSKLENDQVDDLIERARASADQDERQELYDELQEILRYEAPWVLLGVGYVRLSAQANVVGIEDMLLPTQAHYFGNIRFSE